MMIYLVLVANFLWGATPSDSFYDHGADYATFPGRITDRDESGTVLKISSESKNVKFFRSGDLIEFFLPSGRSEDKCSGYVRDVEGNYFVLYAKNITSCWPSDGHIRRGTQLTFFSKALSERVYSASQYRQLLITRKEDFLKQLNDINNFIFAFEEKRVQVAAEYDRKILEITKAKQEAIDHLEVKKKESLVLQRELGIRLDQIERDIDSYRIENHELYTDRWHLDQDLGLPVGTRPQEIKNF